MMADLYSRPDRERDRDRERHHDDRDQHQSGAADGPRMVGTTSTFTSPSSQSSYTEKTNF